MSDRRLFSLGRMSDDIEVVITGATGLSRMGRKPLRCVVKFQGRTGTESESQLVPAAANPTWDFETVLQGHTPDDVLVFWVENRNSKRLGKAVLTADQVMNGWDGALPLVGDRLGRNAKLVVRTTLRHHHFGHMDRNEIACTSEGVMTSGKTEIVVHHGSQAASEGQFEGANDENGSNNVTEAEMTSGENSALRTGGDAVIHWDDQRVPTGLPGISIEAGSKRIACCGFM